MKVFIVDAGAFGTAFAIMLARAGRHKVTLLIQPYNQAQKDLYYNLHSRIQKTNYLYLPNVEIPESVFFTDSFEAAVDADIILLAVPSKYIWGPFFAICHRLKRNSEGALALLSKGFDHKTPIPLGVAMNDFLRIDAKNYPQFYHFAVVSGPTFAGDLLAPYKTHIASIASYNLNAIKKLKEMLRDTDLRLEGTTDLVGVSWGGCLKNAYAIGYGICDGLGYSETMLNNYIWLAHKELKVFSDFAGAKQKTYMSPAVWGDLCVTCKGESRNRAFGRFVAGYQSKESIGDYLKKNTVEGYESMVKIWEIAHEKGFFAPLLFGTHSIACGGASPNVFKGYFNVASGKGWALSND